MDGVRGGHEACDNARSVEEKHRELDATYAVKGRISSPSAACLSGIPGPPGFCLAQMQIRVESFEMVIREEMISRHGRPSLTVRFPDGPSGNPP